MLVVVSLYIFCVFCTYFALLYCIVLLHIVIKIVDHCFMVCSLSEGKRYHMGTPLSEVIEGMRDPSKGVTLLQHLSCLPPHTFVSADATTWVCDNVEGASSEVTAVNFLQVGHYSCFG